MDEAQRLTSRARGAMASLGAVAVTDAAAIPADFFYAQYLRSLPPEAIVEELELVASEAFYFLIGVAQLAVFLVAIVLFIRWFRLCYDNSAKLTGGPTDYSPRWVLWGFFVPILNLFRPYQLMREIWDSTTWKWDEEPFRVLGLSRPTDRIGLWWGFFITTNVISNAVGRLSWGATTAQEELHATWGLLLSDSFDLIAAAVTIVLVRNVTQLQRPFLADARLGRAA